MRTPPEEPQGIQADSNWLKDYFCTLVSLLTHPERFFRSLPKQPNASQALAFALVTHWIGTAASTLWKLGVGHEPQDFIQTWFLKFMSQSGPISSSWNALQTPFSSWLFSTSGVLIDPFVSLGALLVSTALAYPVAYLLIPNRSQLTFLALLVPYCYAMGSSIFLALPWIGAFLSGLSGILLTILGIRQRFQISTSRAALIFLSPWLVSVFFLLLIFGLLVIGFLGLTR
ncbi:MAG: YIP1 family protein [Bdellovibrionia bacterium]